MNFIVKDYIFVKKEISNNCTDDQIGFTINRTITNFKKKRKYNYILDVFESFVKKNCFTQTASAKPQWTHYHNKKTASAKTN